MEEVTIKFKCEDSNDIFLLNFLTMLDTLKIQYTIERKKTNTNSGPQYLKEENNKN